MRSQGAIENTQDGVESADGSAGLDAAQEEKVRYAAPATLAGAALAGTLWPRRFAKALDKQARGLEGPRVGLERIGPAGEGEGQTAALDRDLDPSRLQVRPLDDEAGVVLVTLEGARVGQRMSDADAETAGWSEHTSRLMHGCGHVLDVHQDHVGDHQVEFAVGKG